MPTRFNRYRRVVDLRKLGTCTYCVGLAARLSLLCWTGYIISTLYFHVTPVTLASLVLALPLSALLLLHSVAYAVLVTVTESKTEMCAPGHNSETLKLSAMRSSDDIFCPTWCATLLLNRMTRRSTGV
jgi:hypothetical protein